LSPKVQAGAKLDFNNDVFINLDADNQIGLSEKGIYGERG
jgi:hypothetical protein